MPKNDFFLIKDLERENLKQNKDPVLITIVNEILRLNNYVIGFFKGIGKVPLNTALEINVFEQFQVVSDFSFRKIKRIDEPKKRYVPFRDSGSNNYSFPHSVSTTTTITIIQSELQNDSPVYVNLFSNLYEQTIRENFISENQTLNSSHHHFPKKLIFDTEIKIQLHQM